MYCFILPSPSNPRDYTRGRTEPEKVDGEIRETVYDHTMFGEPRSYEPGVHNRDVNSSNIKPS